jgi:hypothetical protein
MVRDQATVTGREGIVITDSVPWKNDLTRVADRLEARAHQKRWTERTSYLVERDVLVGAFSARKLLDSHKVSQQTSGRSFPVQMARLTGESADPWTAYFYWQNYDVENKQDAHLGLRDLTNQLIHSMVLFPSATETPPHRLDGVIVGSDHAVGTQVFFVPLASLVLAFRSVGLDEPMVWQMRKDAKGKRVITVLP